MPSGKDAEGRAGNTALGNKPEFVQRQEEIFKRRGEQPGSKGLRELSLSEKD